MIITDLEVASAVTAAEDAEAEYARVGQSARGRREIDEQMASTLGVAQARAWAARAQATELAERRTQQAAELRARENRETAALPALGKAQRELEARWADLIGHVAAGRLPEALAAMEAHNTAVAAAHAELTRLGLLLADVDQSAEHATGAGERGALRLRGRFWRPGDPSTLAARMALRHVLCLYGTTHIVAKRLEPLAHLDRALDDVFAAVPSLEPRTQPERRRPPAYREDRAVPAAGRGPFLAHAALDAMAQPKPVPGWEERYKEQFGRYPDGAA